MAATTEPPRSPRPFDEAFLKKLEYLHIVARKAFAGRARAERPSRKVGSGLEFADHRAYSPGDDLRYLDWNLYGRLDRLLVRLFQEEEDLSIEILIDTSRSMAVPGSGKLGYAVRLAAALCYIGLANLDRVGIQAFSGRLGERLPPGRGKGRIFKVLEFLGSLSATGPTSIGDSLSEFVHRTERRGVAVVISDFFDGSYVTGLNLLRYHRFEPSVMQVLEPAGRPEALRGEVDLVDCESGESHEMIVSPRLLAAHQRARALWLDEIERFCRARQMPFVRATTEVPFEDVVLRTLRSGGLVK